MNGAKHAEQAERDTVVNSENQTHEINVVTEEYPMSSCKVRHRWIAWGFSLAIPLLCAGLGGVFYIYVHTDAVTAKALKQGRTTHDELQMQLRGIESEAATTLSEVKVNAATAAVETRAIRDRLEGMSARQERVESKTDHILQTVLEIERNGSPP